MAVITQTSLRNSGSQPVNITVLSDSDTLTYFKGQRQLLILRNSADPLAADPANDRSPNIVGNTATTVPVRGYGELDVSAGYTCPVIAAGESVVVALDSISAYLSGAEVTVTGGDGLVAQLLG